MNLTVRENRTETECKTAAFRNKASRIRIIVMTLMDILAAFRNKASRIRIIVMTLMDILFSWLACGVTYAAIRPGLPFRHALISPVSLIIMIPESAAWFYLIRTIRNSSR